MGVYYRLNLLGGFILLNFKISRLLIRRANILIVNHINLIISLHIIDKTKSK